MAYNQIETAKSRSELIVRHGGKTAPLGAQSIELSDKSRVSAFVEGEFGEENVDGRLLSQLDDQSKTLYEVLRRGVQLSGAKPAIGARTGPNQDFEWQTYDQTLQRITNVGSGLLKIGLKSKDFVGIYMQNCVEFFLTQHACVTHSMVCVPLYDTLGAQAIEHILNEAKLTVVVCTAAKLTSLFHSDCKLEALQTVVVIEEVADDDREKAQARKVKIVAFSELEHVGATEITQADSPPTPDDLVLVCYTSGTTGKPKGVMISHGNFTAELYGLRLVTSDCFSTEDERIYLSFLPMAHILEQVVQGWTLSCGGRIGFWRNDIKTLLEDAQALRPTLFVVVPRLLNRMYDNVTAAVKSGGRLKRAIFNKAMKSKKAALAKGVVRRNTIWDKLVFKKVQDRLGGRVQAVATGSAPISDEVLTFARCALGCVVVQGYGQTESCGAATTSLFGDYKPGHVGPPIACSRIKLMSVPDMGYLEENSEGEVCIKGAIVFKGYLNNKDKTDEALDGAGWLHTGDIGRWTSDGTLTIIDRKKDIFKLAQGEYVAPEKVEMAYGRASLVSQVFVHGDSLQSACVAVVVPDEISLPRWAKEHSKPTDLQELCKDEDLKQAILKEMTDLGKGSGLKSFEQARAIHLHHDPFTVENGLVTPTFKLKRPNLRALFKNEIAELYAGQKT